MGSVGGGNAGKSWLGGSVPQDVVCASTGGIVLRYIQGALVEVLEGHGIDNIAVCANVPEASSRVVGEVLAEAVQAAQRKPRAQRGAPAAGGAAPPQPVPRWAEDTDHAHVAAGGLPNIAEELKGRMKVRPPPPRPLPGRPSPAFLAAPPLCTVAVGPRMPSPPPPRFPAGAPLSRTTPSEAALAVPPASVAALRHIGFTCSSHAL